MNISVNKKAYFVVPYGYLKSFDDILFDISESGALIKKEQEEELTGRVYKIIEGSISFDVDSLNGSPFVKKDAKQGGNEEGFPEENVAGAINAFVAPPQKARRIVQDDPLLEEDDGG